MRTKTGMKLWILDIQWDRHGPENRKETYNNNITYNNTLSRKYVNERGVKGCDSAWKCLAMCMIFGEVLFFSSMVLLIINWGACSSLAMNE